MQHSLCETRLGLVLSTEGDEAPTRSQRRRWFPQELLALSVQGCREALGSDARVGQLWGGRGHSIHCCPPGAGGIGTSSSCPAVEDLEPLQIYWRGQRELSPQQGPICLCQPPDLPPSPALLGSRSRIRPICFAGADTSHSSHSPSPSPAPSTPTVPGVAGGIGG